MVKAKKDKRPNTKLQNIYRKLKIEQHENPIKNRFMLLNLKSSLQCFVDHCLSLCLFSYGNCLSLEPLITHLIFRQTFLPSEHASIRFIQGKDDREYDS